MGADKAEIWLLKLAMPAMVATLSRGAINDGTGQARGAAADNPPVDMLIQNRAAAGVFAVAAPTMPRPRLVPQNKTVRRTRCASHPRCRRASTNQPPTAMSVKVAN